MAEIDGCPADYLGDGVYAIHRGYCIELRANDARHPTDTIFLDAAVLNALVAFDRRLTEPGEPTRNQP